MLVTRKTVHAHSFTRVRPRQIRWPVPPKANLELWKDKSDALLRSQPCKSRQLNHSAAIRALQTFAVAAPSQCTRSEDEGYRPFAGVGPKLHAFFKVRNLLLRPLGNTIYVMPPYCVTPGDLHEIYAVVYDAADALA